MGIYVWLDVAVVYVLCAVPIGMALAGVVRRSLSRMPALLVAAVTLIVVIAFLSVPIRANMPLLLGLRAATALLLATSAALAWSALSGRPTATPARGSVFLGLVLLLVMPDVYVGARAKNDLARFNELMAEGRTKEAHLLALSLNALNPATEWNNTAMAKLAGELGEMVVRLELAVASPEHRDGAVQARLQRAQFLAMLDRTDEALAILASIATPEADNLRGTIFQVRGEWQASLEAYGQARQGLERRDESAERTMGLAQAVKGIAFSKRRLGRYDEAEASYQELLRLAPNAETHFLLAQFYDDAQDAKKARMHARQAMALDPQRYEDSGRQLIRKMSVFQFGCWGVFSAETSSLSPP